MTSVVVRLLKLSHLYERATLSENNFFYKNYYRMQRTLKQKLIFLTFGFNGALRKLL